MQAFDAQGVAHADNKHAVATGFFVVDQHNVAVLQSRLHAVAMHRQAGQMPCVQAFTMQPAFGKGHALDNPLAVHLDAAAGTHFHIIQRHPYRVGIVKFCRTAAAATHLALAQNQPVKRNTSPLGNLDALLERDGLTLAIA